MELINTSLPILGSIIIVSLTYFLTKERERISEWRKEKLKFYIRFMNSLSGITDSEISSENEIKFAKACNDLYLLSPIKVIHALKEFQDKIRITNIKSTPKEKHDTLSNLVYEMRKDIGAKLKKKRSFSVELWTSALENKKPNIDTKLFIKDIAYELQLLLGATEIIKSIEVWDKSQSSDKAKFGNIINYYKDSAYIHLRNLFNIITGEAETDLGKIPKIESDLYRKWKPSIEKFVMHLNGGRDQKGASNKKQNNHLNNVLYDLTIDLINCWKKWADTLETSKKQLLLNTLIECQDSAISDRKKLSFLVTAKS